MKKILTIAGTGRCGTTKLQTILKQVPGVFVEMEEDFNDLSVCTVRIPSINNPTVADQFIKRKLHDIETNPEYASYNTFAVDGHVTGNNFLQYFLNNGVIPNTFILRRPPREVALSLFRLNWIPGRNPLILMHFNGPNEPDVMPYNGWQTAHHYQLCFWYCCEIERRLRNVKLLLQENNVPFYEMTMKQMLDINHFNAALKLFDLPLLGSISPDKVNESEIYDHNNNQLFLSQDPPNDLLDKLEQEVLNNIPVEDRDYINASWKTFWPI